MKILVINPGSTSTKMAVFEDESPVLVRNIVHTPEELAGFDDVIEQQDFRRQLVLDELRQADIPVEFDAVIGRGGLVKPLEGGVYEINDLMIQDTHSGIALHNHACNLGCLIAHEIAASIPRCRSFIADPGVVDELNDYDFIAVTTGGSPKVEGIRWLERHEVESPVPSLFTFQIDDKALQTLMGTVVENAVTMIPGTKMRAEGPLLITHWGMSGPAILKLSSYAARHLAECGYKSPLAVNWTNLHDNEVLSALDEITIRHSKKQLQTISPCGLPSRLWSYLVEKCLGERSNGRWGSLNKKELNRLANILSGGDMYQIAGRAPFKDEFVTCGGVSLSSVNPATLESKEKPHLYFAGEVLDIDGITGGFNFQAAWTTAYTVAQAITKSCQM